MKWINYLFLFVINNPISIEFVNWKHLIYHINNYLRCLRIFAWLIFTTKKKVNKYILFLYIYFKSYNLLSIHND